MSEDAINTEKVPVQHQGFGLPSGLPEIYFDMATLTTTKFGFAMTLRLVTAAETEGPRQAFGTPIANIRFSHAMGHEVARLLADAFADLAKRAEPEPDSKVDAGVPPKRSRSAR
jgi:hypothetical protein